jgi:hypothetical protein
MSKKHFLTELGAFSTLKNAKNPEVIIHKSSVKHFANLLVIHM